MVTSTAPKKTSVTSVTFTSQKENYSESHHWNDWMIAAQAGDQRCYRSLLTAIQPWLKSYFRKRIAADKVEDLMQDTLLSIHRKRHTYDPQYPFGVWLAAVAKHRLIDYYRARARQLTEALPDDDHLPSITEDASMRYDIERLLNALPVRQATIIRLLKLEQRHVAEVANTLEMSETAVKVTLHRSLKKLTSLISLQTDA